VSGCVGRGPGAYNVVKTAPNQSNTFVILRIGFIDRRADLFPE